MRTQSLFSRLARDVSANVIAISAAAMIPLAAMVGGGVDASRYYMADSRLQAACDAGALAGRRAMGSDPWATEHETIANNFFDLNFPDGMFGLDNLSRSYAADDDGVVTGTMSGELPTSLMGIFGYEDFQLSITCEANIGVENTDIVFVLDVTGSMGSKIRGVQKIQSLREATLNFYDTVETVNEDRSQLRYGIVPYANGVNVGAMILTKNPSWMANHHTYQSRLANFTTTESWEPTEDGFSLISAEEPDSLLLARTEHSLHAGYDSTSCSSAKPEDAEAVIPANFDYSSASLVSGAESSPRTATYEFADAIIEFWDGYADFTSSGECALGYTVYEYEADIEFSVTEELVTEARFQNYTYGPIGTTGSGETYEWPDVDLRDAYDDYSIDLPIGTNGGMLPIDWNGCIEEAATAEGQTVFDPVPAAARDLDIDLVPTIESERWKPVLNRAISKRRDPATFQETIDVVISGRNFLQPPTDACPRSARKLAPIDSRTELEDYLAASSGFIPYGATYHDIGMIWGGRLISPDGIFSDENQVGENGRGIERHIIFMTDGKLETSVNNWYSPYGVEFWDRRITTDGLVDTANANHAARFQAACRAVRNKNISVWVVAFGTTLTQNLIDCASSGRAFHAADGDELDAAFSEIAEKIAQLRLTA